MLSFFLAVSLATTIRPEMIVSTDWLAQNIREPNVLVLDVSTADQYNRGHIAGAVFLNAKSLVVRRNDIPNELPPVAELEALFRDAGVTPATRIILTSDDPLLAARAWFTLDYLGWGDRAAILDGGNAKWRAERHAVNTVITQGKAGDFKANVDVRAVITRDELKALLASNEPFVLLDARDTQHFVGKKKGAEVQHAGHILNADCFPWMANLTKNGVLKPAEQLAQLYGSLDVRSADQRIVLYCRTGVEASLNYFVLRYLGFRPTLYDGSFVEWNKTEAVATTGR